MTEEELVDIWSRLDDRDRAVLLATARALDAGGTATFLTVPQLSMRYGVPRSTIYDAMRGGLIPFVTPAGGTRGMRIRASDFEGWLSSCSR